MTIATKMTPGLSALALAAMLLGGCTATSDDASAAQIAPEVTSASFDAGVTTVATTEGLVSTEWLVENSGDPNLIVLHIARE